MARTEQEIYDAILAAKDSEDDLTNLNSTSNVAIWRLWAGTAAEAIYLHETLFDTFKAEVDTTIAAAQPGTIPWLKQKALEFQYGYQLKFINGKPGYDVDDPEARIIARVAFVEGTTLQVKVSQYLSGELAPLFDELGFEQLSAFKTYMDQIGFAGTNFEFINLNGDQLQLYPSPSDGSTGTFYYDPSIPLQTIKDDLDAKVGDYLKSLDYNGWLYKKKLDDKIQGVVGYVDFDFNPWQVKVSGASTWTDMGRRYQPLSGYMVLFTALSNHLNFVPVTDVQS